MSLMHCALVNEVWVSDSDSEHCLMCVQLLFLDFTGATENFEEPFADTNTDVAEVAIAFYNGLWAFDGW